MSKKKIIEAATLEQNENGTSTIVVHDTEKFIEHLENVSEALQKQTFTDGTVGDLQVTIIKAAITKDDQLKVEHQFTRKDGNGGTWAGPNDAIVHADLQAAFAELTPHLVLLCNQKLDDIAREILDGKYGETSSAIQDELQEYSVTGFACGKANDGITIIGHKDISGKILNLTSPFEPFSESSYPFITELQDVLTRCKNEVVQYLNGKSGFKQLDAFEEGSDILSSKQEEEIPATQD